MTLIEIIIAMALLFLVASMVCDVLVKAYQVHVRTTTKVSNYRLATVAMGRISRELLTCNYFSTPALGTWPAVTCDNGTTPPGGGPATVLQFQRNNDVTENSETAIWASGNLGGASLSNLSGANVTYWLDVPSQQLCTLVPAATGGSTMRVVAFGVTQFWVGVQTGSYTGAGGGLTTVNVTINVDSINTPIQLQVAPPMMHT